MVDTFTSESLGSNQNQQQREALRKRIRAARLALTDEQLSDASEALKNKVLKTLSQLDNPNPIQRVAGYLAFQGEINVSPIMDALRSDGVFTYVPMLDGDTLAFAQWSEHTPTRTNRFGIIEPTVPKSEWLSASEMDVVLVPLVAFEPSGQRMGMGGGFYDKTFAVRREQNAPPWLIGVAHQLQRVDSVYAQWWDVPLDQVITD